MSSLSSRPIAPSELSASVTAEEQGLLVSLVGTADLRSTEAVESLLAGVHKRALSGAVDEVRVDLRNLEFMNSSCFKSFVTWISQVQDLPEPAQYRIRFLSSPAILWQRRSLNALSCFAAHLVTIESIRS
jgi:hypothetical protein